jgi:hypothetical protein
MSSKTPVFELVHVPIDGTEDERKIASRFVDHGFPRGLIGREYKLRPSATVVDSEGRRLIWFADCLSNVKMCVDVQSGAVVTFSGSGKQQIRRVNSSLDQFSIGCGSSGVMQCEAF